MGGQKRVVSAFCSSCGADFIADCCSCSGYVLDRFVCPFCKGQAFAYELLDESKENIDLLFDSSLEEAA